MLFVGSGVSGSPGSVCSRVKGVPPSVRCNPSAFLPPSRPPPSFPLFGPELTLRARGFPFGFVRFKVSRSRVLTSLPSFRLPDHPPVVQACFGAPAGGGGSRLKGSILLVRCKSAAPLLASPRADGRPSPLYTRGVPHGFLLPRVWGIPPRRPRLSRAPTLSFWG